MEMQQLYTTINSLDQQDLAKLYRYIEQRLTSHVWIISPENLAAIDEVMKPVQAEAAPMSEDEINSTIDEAIAEVRNARKTQSGN